MDSDTGKFVMGKQLPKNTKNLKNVPLAKTLRRNASQSERKLRPLLNQKLTGFKFRFQHPVKNYILDFYCPRALLCVELDGDQHNLEQDSRRDLVLDDLGILTYRIPASDIWNPDFLRLHLDQIFKLCVERSRHNPFEAKDV